jgi:hypothetical protein
MKRSSLISSDLFHFPHLGVECDARVFLCTKEGKQSKDSENLLMGIVEIDLAQQYL